MFKSLVKNPKQMCICNAPFVSMYFRPDGKVSPCCFNHEFIYGKYPEQSIEEIWTGDQIKKFRQIMVNSDFSHGCETCEKHIKTDNMSTAGFQHYKMKPLKKYPAKLEFELSYQCNLNCIMCFQHMKLKLNSEIYGDDFFLQIKKYLPHISEASYFGGEPFVIDLYYKIWEEINKNNKKCIQVLQTNGTIWNKRIKSILTKGNFEISISLDAIDKDIYEQIRINANLETTISNVNHFNDYMKLKQKPLFITVCPMRNNAYNIPDIVLFTSKINADIYFHSFWSPISLSLINHDKDQLSAIIEYYKVFMNSNDNLSTQNKQELMKLTGQIERFVESWNKRTELMSLNKDYSYWFNKLIERFISEGREKDIFKFKKLDPLFQELLTTFPIVYGLQYIFSNVGANVIAEISKYDNDDDILEFIKTKTLFATL